MGNPARTWYDEMSQQPGAQPQAPVTELERLAQELLATVDAAGVAIAHEDAQASGALVCIVSLGVCVPPVGAHLDPESGISGRCVRESRTQRCFDTRLDPRVDRAASERLGISSLLAAPLLVNSRCVGLVEAVSTRPGHFDEERVRALEEAARGMAQIIEVQLQPSDHPVPDAHSLVVPIEESTPQGESPFMSGPALVRSPEQQEEPAVGVSDQPQASKQQVFLPSFLEPHPRRKWSWLLWAALVLLAIVASVASTRVLRSGKSQEVRSAAGPLPTASQKTEPNESSTSTARAETVAPERPAAKLNADKINPDLAQRAERGDVAAQMALAHAYLLGEGVPQDRAKAASWYIVAGENGSAEAKLESIAITRGLAPFEIGEIRFDLGKMYMNGIGTEKDYVSAYSWFELAKAAGDIRAADEEAALEKNMNPDQVVAAKKRASDWLQSHFRKAAKPSPGK